MIAALAPIPAGRVLDLGCGSGCVALAAAASVGAERVLAVDSSARAIECVTRGAELNALPSIVGELNPTGCFDAPGTFDHVLANPPYYANFRIAQLFVEAARRALKPDGRLTIVTKSPEWYQTHLDDDWQRPTIVGSGQYYLIDVRRAED